MDIIQTPSPNHDERSLPVNLLVLHYTGMQTGRQALERLCDVGSKVSAHYLVHEDGHVSQMVEESRRAWHGGVGYWRGITDVNSASIGVEIVNPGHEWGYRDFPIIQMQAVSKLCQGILSRHKILPRDVIGHSDIAPLRKQDPGERFDWKGLAKQGIGLWPKLSHATLDELSKQDPVSITRYEQLADYGYTLADEAKAITAFQRHFRPNLLNGLWDAECAAILASLLEQA